jgi:hypothetical protein
MIVVLSRKWNERADARQDVITREQPTRPRIAETEVIGLMAGCEHDLEAPGCAQRDLVTVLNGMGRPYRF